jgi:hypothetical protein
LKGVVESEKTKTIRVKIPMSPDDARDFLRGKGVDVKKNYSPKKRTKKSR